MMIRPYLALLIALMTAATVDARDTSQDTWTFDIPSQPIASALVALATQTDVVFKLPHRLGEHRTVRLSGRLTLDAALRDLLAGTGLAHEFIDPRTVRIFCTPAQCTKELDRDPGQKADDRGARSDVWAAAAPEVLIRGTKALNTGIPRGEDDAQPYAVFEREHIGRSQAASLEDFLDTHLTMNTAPAMPDPRHGQPAYVIPFVMGGLGPDETLILVNGRPAPRFFTGGGMAQSGLNMIPASSIERIEVLPGAASGIHGGSATAGVINVVLRTEITGLHVNADFERMVNDVDASRVFAHYGFRSSSGDTTFTLRAGLGRQQPVLMKDMPFLEEARARAERSALLSGGGHVPPLGEQTNISSLTGAGLFGPGTPAITSVPKDYRQGDGLEPFRAIAGAYNLEPAKTAQTLGTGSGILYGTTLQTLSFAFRSQLTPEVAVYADAVGSQTHAWLPASGVDSIGLRGVMIPASAPANPFKQDILVTIPSPHGDGILSDETALYHAVLGTVIALGADWSATFEFARAGSKLRLQRPLADPQLLEAIATGRVDVLRDASALEDLADYSREFRTSWLPAKSTTYSARVAGRLAELPAGEITLTGLLQRHKEEMGDGTGTEFLNSGFDTPFIAQSVLTEQIQVVDSAFAEVHIPVISDGHALFGIRSLELQASVRTDVYRTYAAPVRVAPDASVADVPYTRSEFRSTNPVIGVRLRPFEPLLIRASYGTGFLAPAVSQLAQPTERRFPVGTFFDPRRGHEPVPDVLVRAGGNPDLAPERSQSWSAGFILKPQRLPEFRLSIDYLHLDKRDNIVARGDLPFVDLDGYERDFPTSVVRGPALPGDPFDVGPITAIDTTAINVAENEVEVWNLGLRYGFPLRGIGKAEISTVATWQPTFASRMVPSLPMRNDAGVSSDSPLPLRANAMFILSRENWMIGWTARYYSGYEVSRNPEIVAVQGSERVADRTYHDFFARYHLPPPGASWPRLHVTLGVKNVFNEAPPFDSGAIDSGFVSPFADPRLSTFFLSFGTDA